MHWIDFVIHLNNNIVPLQMPLFTTFILVCNIVKLHQEKCFLKIILRFKMFFFVRLTHFGWTIVPSVNNIWIYKRLKWPSLFISISLSVKIIRPSSNSKPFRCVLFKETLQSNAKKWSCLSLQFVFYSFWSQSMLRSSIRDLVARNLVVQFHFLQQLVEEKEEKMEEKGETMETMEESALEESLDFWGALFQHFFALWLQFWPLSSA